MDNKCYELYEDGFLLVNPKALVETIKINMVDKCFAECFKHDPVSMLEELLVKRWIVIPLYELIEGTMKQHFHDEHGLTEREIVYKKGWEKK